MAPCYQQHIVFTKIPKGERNAQCELVVFSSNHST